MAQLVSSTNILLRSTPQVVGAISTADCLEGLSQVSEIASECDVLELRLDSIQFPLNELHAHAAQLTLPRIITARHPDEGGVGNLDAAQRLALLEAHLDVASLMDVELRSISDLLPVIRKAQAAGIGVIGSFHDFTSTPSDEVLQGAVDFALQFKLNAVKIATSLHNAGDLARLISLAARERRLPLSIMGMGPLGRTSRLVLAKCGSILNYGYLGQSNAPGQWPAKRLKELLSEL